MEDREQHALSSPESDFVLEACLPKEQVVEEV